MMLCNVALLVCRWSAIITAEIIRLMLTFSSTMVDFIRRWLLLHINMRVNISLVSDFLVKLMRLTMSFFDTKQMGDILQRMGDLCMIILKTKNYEDRVLCVGRRICML